MKSSAMIRARLGVTIGAMILACAGANIAMAQQDASSTPPMTPPVTDAKPAEVKTDPKPKALSVGDAAPALSIAKWVKGDTLSGFEKGKVYVVEFWATWCGPCIMSMPHLSELQREYQARGLTVIGVTSKDGRGNTLDKVTEFIKEKGETISYSIAWDDEDKTNNAFMKAAKQRGIPCSFVVDQKGNIAYIGHPSQLDPVLASVVGGTWDYVEGPKKLRELEKRMRDIGQTASDDPAKALKLLNEVIVEHPYMIKNLEMFKYMLQVETGDTEAAKATGNAIVDRAVAKKDQGSLNELAWTIVDPDGEHKFRDVDLALRAAMEAEKLTGGTDPAVLDTLARCYWTKGEKAKAVQAQAKAVELAKGQMKEELENTLEEYKEQAKP